MDDRVENMCISDVKLKKKLVNHSVEVQDIIIIVCSLIKLKELCNFRVYI